MTLNELLKKGQKISWMLTSGDIPLTMNGQPVEIYDITLEGNCRFCKERRQKELEELVSKLNEK